MNAFYLGRLLALSATDSTTNDVMNGVVAKAPASPRLFRKAPAAFPGRVRFETNSSCRDNKMSRRARKPVAANPKRDGGRRVTQEHIDRMATLRRQGVSFEEIGVKVGCSERTARRYAGQVERHLVLPARTRDSDFDPRALRETLLVNWMERLHADTGLRAVTARIHRIDEWNEEWIYGCPPSILFLSEAEHQLRGRLSKTGDLALRLMARADESQVRFIQEVVGALAADYISWHRFSQNFSEAGDDWRPPSERPPIAPLSYENPFGFDDD